ncbi:MAG: groS [Parcubacteria group bacterium]|nr:groS [Parcubacteria group bacterium]
MAQPEKTTKNKLSITPLADRVVVKPLSREDVSTSGIIIPDTASREKPERGTVVAVGAGRYDNGSLVPMAVKVGDQVLFSKYGYDEVKIDGTEYFILTESGVLAIL